MDEAAMGSRYWCYSCHQMVNPIREVEDVKCPLCQGGFVEEVDGGGGATDANGRDLDSDFSSDRNLSLWAPILLGMMGTSRRHRRSRRTDFEEDYDYSDDGEARHGGGAGGGQNDLDSELESIIRRRRRSSAAILQLLQGLGSVTENSLEDTDRERARHRHRDRERYRDLGRYRDRDRDRDRDRERERVILINPFNQAIMVHGYDSNGGGQSLNETPIGSLGDYFVGPGLDLLLQHLAENDANRYGTPPAQKEVIEALPTVRMKETVQCSVCLDDFVIGSEAKEMPCKHKFHNGCILPWLELHSSCPVCRFQLPADTSTLDRERSSNRSRSEPANDGSGNEGSTSRAISGEGAEVGNGGGRRFSLPWPFSGWFSSSNASNSPASSSSSTPSANAHGPATNSSQTHEY